MLSLPHLLSSFFQILTEKYRLISAARALIDPLIFFYFFIFSGVMTWPHFEPLTTPVRSRSAPGSSCGQLREARKHSSLSPHCLPHQILKCLFSSVNMLNLSWPHVSWYLLPYPPSCLHGFPQDWVIVVEEKKECVRAGLPSLPPSLPACCSLTLACTQRCMG